MIKSALCKDISRRSIKLVHFKIQNCYKDFNWESLANLSMDSAIKLTKHTSDNVISKDSMSLINFNYINQLEINKTKEINLNNLEESNYFKNFVDWINKDSCIPGQLEINKCLSSNKYKFKR